ncbi:hypothetical protein Nit79A3_1497 [Nitrosomonas sp. Is79A3]|uniref:DUF5906 domain-containing protein n=1 Tax=Nitrosomonas sp. (strain Is79A3) TaxID=261292 RepID=UPI000215D1BF
MFKNKVIKIKNIQFTVFADLNKKTAKSYDLSEDGKLVKGPMSNFWEGAFQTVELPPSDLSDFIMALQPGYFLIQGVHQSLTDGCCPEDTARLKETFPFTNNPGLICIDTDSAHKFGIKSVEELNDALEKIEPGLKNILKIMSTSASSYVSINGKEGNGLRGIHTFIPIDSTLNNESILKTLHIRSIIAGYAYPKVTKAGTIMINSLIDIALCTSNQPIFEGGAILKNESITQKRVIESFEGEVLQANSLPPLTEQEIAVYERIGEELKAKVKVEAAIARQKYTSETSIRITSRNNKLTDEKALDIVNQAIDHNRLPAEFIILLESGEEVTVQEILDNPKKYHEVACAHPLDQEILGKSIIYSNQEKPLIHSFAHGGDVFFLGPDSEEAVMDWSIALKEFVLDFNETHAQVMIGGKHRIMRTVAAEIHHESRTSYEFIKQEELRKVYANDQIQVGEKIIGEMVVPILKDKISAWTNHENSITYKGGVVFAPGKQLPDDYYNSWQGFAIEPISGANIDIIKKHIELIICKGDRQLIEYFYNWIAYTFQHPDKPAGSALVLRGEKGCGKGSIGHFLRKIWGQHGIHISNPKHLTGNFNAHLADTCFLFADEAFYSGDKQHEGVLKALITEPTLIIERKGLDAESLQNFLKIFMVTNNDYAVPASKDERRYCVFDVASNRTGDKKYFDELHAACANEAIQSAFLFEMLNRDITNFHTGAIPETQGLKDQRLASLSSVGKWFVDSLTQGYFDLKEDNNTLWHNEMTSENLYSSYVTWCDSQRITYRMSQNSLGRYLTKIFGQNRKLKGDKRGYFFGSLLEAISKLEKYEKIDLGLMADDDSLHLDTFEASNDESISSEFNFGMIDERVAPLRVVR